MSKKLEAIFFSSSSGKEPVKAFFKKELNDNETKKIYTAIRTIEISWPLGKPLVDHLKKNIWEIRCSHKNRITRILFGITGKEMVLLHGFVKKTQKTPAKELALAEKRLNEYEK